MAGNVVLAIHGTLKSKEHAGHSQAEEALTFPARRGVGLGHGKVVFQTAVGLVGKGMGEKPRRF